MSRTVNLLFKDLLLTFLSAFLLVVSFPRCEFWLLAWVGLIPLLFVLDGKSASRSFLWAYFCGILFFAGTLFWFIHVTLIGAAMIILYLAVYFGFFGLGYSFFAKESVMKRMALLPSLWVVLEFIRGHMISGFGWVSLGHSQYKILPLIQIADITGMFGVSFLVVMGNVLLKEIIALSLIPLSSFPPSFCHSRESGNLSHRRFPIKTFGNDNSLFIPLLTFIGFLTVILGYGFYRLNEKHSVGNSLSVAIVQANIAQELKWNSRQWPFIMDHYLMLTEEAAEQKPDLILWPETAFPGFIWESPQLFENLKIFVSRLQIPLMLGVVTQRVEEYFNSAVLIDSKGDVAGQHDKIHLVPFGEYIPLRHIFPFLSHIAPIGDFSSGERYTLFSFPSVSDLDRPNNNIGVLICFEDTVPELSREFVNRGANLLVNLTNDAWFQDTKAPFLHLQAAAFRAVENRRTLIRATNTGVSAFIDSRGKIAPILTSPDGRQAFVSGIIQSNAFLETVKTFYTKYGDVFTYFCFGGILILTFRRKIRSIRT